MDYQSAIKKEQKCAIHRVVDGPRGCHVKSETEKQVLYNVTYMWNLEKMIQMKLCAEQKQIYRCREQRYIYQGGKGVWDELGDCD